MCLLRLQLFCFSVDRFITFGMRATAWHLCYYGMSFFLSSQLSAVVLIFTQNGYWRLIYQCANDSIHTEKCTQKWHFIIVLVQLTHISTQGKLKCAVCMCAYVGGACVRAYFLVSSVQDILCVLIVRQVSSKMLWLISRHTIHVNLFNLLHYEIVNGVFLA